MGRKILAVDGGEGGGVCLLLLCQKNQESLNEKSRVSIPICFASFLIISLKMIRILKKMKIIILKGVLRVSGSIISYSGVATQLIIGYVNSAIL